MTPPSGWKTWPPFRQGIQITAALAGDRPTRRRHRESLRLSREFASRLPFIERLGSLERTSPEKPVFILSAGWRSGSTMLQRMLMATRQVMVWGEPYDHCDILGSLRSQWLAFTGKWPSGEFFFTGETEALAGKWVANLYPSLQDLYEAHTTFLTRAFGDPARRAGCPRWGIKEVRWTVDDALFLRWLFPGARFLFLCRDPRRAWRSYRESRSWYLRWPDEPVFTPYRFGRLWARLAQDYLARHAAVGGVMCRYEDLLTEPDYSDIESYLGLRVASPEEIGRVRSRGAATKPAPVPILERWLLDRGLGGAAAKLGYGG